MANQKMLYIELKTNQGDRGPAWIGLASLSASHRAELRRLRPLLQSLLEVL